MSAKLARLPAHESPDVITAALQEDGGVIVDGFLERGDGRGDQRARSTAPLAASDPGDEAPEPGDPVLLRRQDEARRRAWPRQSRTFATEVHDPSAAASAVCDAILLPVVRALPAEPRRT